jgi:hypothetical protein
MTISDMSSRQAACAFSVPVSERDELLGKRTPLKATIDFHPIIVREEQQLTSRLCSDQRVPIRLKGKLYNFGQLVSLVRLELMSRRVVQSAILAICGSPPSVQAPSLIRRAAFIPAVAADAEQEMQVCLGKNDAGADGEVVWSCLDADVESAEARPARPGAGEP